MYLVYWTVNGNKGWMKCKTEEDAIKYRNEHVLPIMDDSSDCGITDLRQTEMRPEYIELKNKINKAVLALQ